MGFCEQPNGIATNLGPRRRCVLAILVTRRKIQCARISGWHLSIRGEGDRACHQVENAPHGRAYLEAVLRDNLKYEHLWISVVYVLSMNTGWSKYAIMNFQVDHKIKRSQCRSVTSTIPVAVAHVTSVLHLIQVIDLVVRT
jgi:hypothetical protein